MLRLEHIAVSYGPVAGTQDISLEVGENEVLALVGSNGAGKSSTLKAIVGLSAYRGTILWQGKPLRALDPENTAGLGIGFSPEGRQVFKQLSVADNLLSGGYITKRSEAIARREQIYGYFPRLRERQRQMAGSLSGGEQQMVAIGRALMCRPKLLLLDEPSLGLAPIAIDKIGEIIIEVRKQEGLSVILAEQNARWSMALSDRTVIVELGRTTLSGASAALSSDDRVQRAYLGL